MFRKEPMGQENKINHDIQIPRDEASKNAQAHETKTETIKKTKLWFMKNGRTMI